jgi:hypothetical protein
MCKISELTVFDLFSKLCCAVENLDRDPATNTNPYRCGSATLIDCLFCRIVVMSP